MVRAKPKIKDLPEFYTVKRYNRFFKYVVKGRGRNACWNWAGSTYSAGYGVFWTGEKRIAAHRAAYMLFIGEIPRGLFVCHTCDNRRCVNPKHLWVGTNQDNMSDMVAKGRQNKLKGSEVGTSKLTESQVKRIREEYRKGSSTEGVEALGRKYGVSHRTIGLLVARKTWKHVK